MASKENVVLYRRENSSAFERDEILPFGAKCIELEDIVSELSETQTSTATFHTRKWTERDSDKYCKLLHMDVN